MGYLLFALFAVIEIALVVFTLTKQPEKVMWMRNRVFIRALEIVLFLLALLFPQAGWDFRFRMCFFVLLLGAFVALIVYAIKKKRATGLQSKAGVIVNAVLGTLLLAIALTPAFLFTGYHGLETTGDYEVKLAAAILTDESRAETFETDGSKREVPVYIYYPDTSHAADATFPLIFFSHGAFGYYQSNSSTYMELASHGYVVVSLEHPYHSIFTHDTNGELITANPEFLQEVMSIQDEETLSEESLVLTQKWLAIRTADMSFAIDTIKEAADKGAVSDTWFVSSDEEKGKILKALAMTDTSRIGLMGHSLGGAASVTIGRERDDISAVIDIDGTMLGEELGYENGAYRFYDEAYPVPLLSIDNEPHYQQGQDAIATGNSYVNNIVLENALNGYHTYFIGSGHMNFTDLPLFSPPLASLLGTGDVNETKCVQTMNDLILMFFDAFLKGTGDVTISDSY